MDLEEILKQTQGKDINCLHSRRNAPNPRLPRTQKVPQLLRSLRHRMAKPAKRIRSIPRRYPDDYQLHPTPNGKLQKNIFTAGPVGFPGVPHISGKDFSPVINKALELPGFQEDTEGKTVLVGFGRNAVLSVAGKVIDSVKSGHIKRFILVGGCDGAKPGRSYYTEFVEKAPKDTIILTLACGKFRFFDKELGTIDDIPRLLDIGQCNDAYSAVKIAMALADAFKVGVNDLPLSMVLSWYEQKAVAILLSLLSLGIKDIRIGPSLPAFITPGILNVLVEKFNIMPIKTPDEDLKAIMK